MSVNDVAFLARAVEAEVQTLSRKVAAGLGKIGDAEEAIRVHINRSSQPFHDRLGARPYWMGAAL